MEKLHSGILKPLRNSLNNKQSSSCEGSGSSGMEIEMEKHRVQVHDYQRQNPSGMEVESVGSAEGNYTMYDENTNPADQKSSTEFERKRRERQLMEKKRIRESFRAQYEDEEELSWPF